MCHQAAWTGHLSEEQVSRLLFRFFHVGTVTCGMSILDEKGGSVFIMVKATVSGIVLMEGKILLVRHTYGVAKGRILIPGGHVKEGEMPERAVSREIQEETGVLAEPAGVVGMRFKKDEWLMLFRMNYVSGTPVSDGYENSEVLLLPPDEAAQRDDITPLSRELCRALSCGTEIEMPYNPGLKFQGIPDNEYMIYGF